MSAQPEHPPLNLRLPFTRADALAAGLTPGDLRGRRFKTVFRGIHISADVRVTAPIRAGPPSSPFLHPEPT